MAVAVQSTQVIWSEPAGHAVSDRFNWLTHVPVLSQHPEQLLMLQAPPPPDEHCPCWHVPPLVVQSWQAAPPAPQCRLVGDVTHVLPLQQPFGQVVELHEPPPVVFVWQAPALQVSPATLQSAQMPPPVPHCESEAAMTQTPAAQHPEHVCGLHEELVSGAPASTVPPPEPPELLPPLLLLPPQTPLLDPVPLLVDPRPPEDEPLLPDDPFDELWPGGPPSSLPRSDP
jgi:hypothetical protein